MEKQITVKTREEHIMELGNYAGPKELFPTIDVDQITSIVSIAYHKINNGRRGQWGLTHEHAETISDDGQVLRITGRTGLKNNRHNTGGRQSFCFFVFRGDSGHLYTHRSVASAGWVNCPPEKLLKRLLKLGIGAVTGVIQQGDFLLKPANGAGLEDSEFRHESMGAGHHLFDCPVLYASGPTGRQYLVKEMVVLRHTATDGIQHPDVEIPPGKWIVGTTSESLRTAGLRD